MLLTDVDSKWKLQEWKDISLQGLGLSPLQIILGLAKILLFKLEVKKEYDKLEKKCYHEKKSSGFIWSLFL